MTDLPQLDLMKPFLNLIKGSLDNVSTEITLKHFLFDLEMEQALIDNKLLPLTLFVHFSLNLQRMFGMHQ